MSWEFWAWMLGGIYLLVLLFGFRWYRHRQYLGDTD